MDHYVWLLDKKDDKGLFWPFIGSLCLHGVLLLILATTAVFYPPTGSAERFNFIWVNTDSIPGEPSASTAPSAEQQKPEPPDRYETIAPPESSAADDIDTPSADDQSEPEVSMVVASKALRKKLKAAALSVTEPVRKEPVDSQPSAADLAEAKHLLQEKAERDRLAAEMARMQLLAAERAAREQAELQRFAKEKTEREVAMALKLERERQARELAEQQRIAAEIAERDRLATEKAAAEKAESEQFAVEKAEAERLAAERAAREKAERDRLAREKAARERLAAALAEEKRLARQRAELERLAALRAEQERIAAARAAAAAREERLAAEKAAAEKAEKARLAQIKAERERAASLRAKQERIARAKASAAPAPSMPSISQALATKSAAIPGEGGNQLEQERKQSIPVPSSAKKVKADVSPEVSLMLATVYGDLKLVVAGTDQLKYRALFKAFPKHRRDRPMTKSESAREQKVVSLVLRTVDNSTEVIIKSTLEGIYVLFAEPDGQEAVTTNFSLKLYEATSRAKAKNLGRKTVSGKTIVARVLMPEGILWDDEAAFTGSLEDSDSVTKFNSETGLMWKEYR